LRRASDSTSPLQKRHREVSILFIVFLGSSRALYNFGPPRLLFSPFHLNSICAPPPPVLHGFEDDLSLFPPGGGVCARFRCSLPALPAYVSCEYLFDHCPPSPFIISPPTLIFGHDRCSRPSRFFRRKQPPRSPLLLRLCISLSSCLSGGRRIELWSC